MIHIDGGQHSGSGTIVRFATAFAGLTRRPLHLRNARAKRPKRGLRPQHLTACYTALALTDHLRTNLWLAEQFGVRVRQSEREVGVEGLALRRS